LRRRDRRTGRAEARPLLALLCLYGPTLCAAQAYDCRPSAKYECTAQRCEAADAGFEHAESFSLDRSTGMLSACLWTNCYEGKAAVVADRKAASFTAVARLKPAHPGNDPLVVVLSVNAQNAFTAAWGLDGGSVTLDWGRCTRTR